MIGTSLSAAAVASDDEKKNSKLGLRSGMVVGVTLPNVEVFLSECSVDRFSLIFTREPLSLRSPATTRPGLVGRPRSEPVLAEV